MITVPYRRRRESKTDYNKRLKLLISHKTRVVIRKTLKNITIQFVNYDAKGAVIAASSSSIQLLKMGWNYSRNNLSASYLTGLIAGKAAIEKGIKAAIVDIGMNESVKGSKLYSAVKGIMDAGVKINCSEKILPTEDRISGKHIAAYAAKLKEQGSYKNVDASAIEKTFNDIKNKVLGK